ncbi:MAG TPA: DUF2804 domain-containing protein [Leptospiraceae bacterium]|nr:DUF2804 domain-containing protein [Leptospiraceae bacterium]HMW07539.1 DUF2804 domain-containing protein [Leptospiraceae bacterium]HMX33283.1 DUF2804 domain-containing protein [Leptospiraceae bacterium]HMY33160.1 DUF2804 domain-containing protein [Leptospiraceae bacterium]HMZ67542.1 DUF2804 domain-containing protein [Leptospiraceae bacterium]
MKAKKIENHAQEKLIQANGMPSFGIFNHPINEVNFKDYKYLNPFGKIKNSISKHFAYNQFEYVGGVSDKIIFGVAIADLKFLTNAFFYIYLPETGKFLHKSLKQPFSIGSKFSNFPETGVVSFSKGKNKIEMAPLNGRRKLLLELSSGETIDAEFLEEKIEPLRICTRAGVNGWVYVRKTAGSPVVGKIECSLGKFDLEKLGVLGHNDYSVGFMRRETFWNWTCFTAKINSQIISVNLSCGVNETSYSENSLWIDGVRYPLSQVAFQYDKENIKKEWKVFSLDKSIDLTFIPEGNYKENINAYILASNFNQLYGKYFGKLQLPNKKFIKLDGIYGYAEDHYAKW